ncbi:hypothetical protein Aab01nite_06180 [Paractinoplanes abujensis]|uniref:Peptidase MA-like domain-containing protein n=1 Tax=Paractinoplanes abujensis TaxID=882441 RepID=A0A7W7G0G4_9ACTN|nr:hypothetical protein [Actinoplanes abujensis]MBB4691554.1 hypothetical protein [Actinoplanes abujensis]GID17028.1 hypothetical protein Aab01nite_06180 [Actinoplanes abujensis]
MRRAFTATLVIGVLLLTIGLVISRPERPRVAIAAGPGTAADRPATPFDRAVAALEAHAEALIAGDEQGWLAAVDTPLRTRYRNMFRSLRALDVTRFDYETGVGQPVRGNPAAVSFRAEVNYCLGTDMCPDKTGSDWQGPPHIEQRLTMRETGGRYVISAAAPGPSEDPRRPAPWENGELVALRGSRVTLFAAPAQRAYLNRVLPLAEAAARVDDRFAALIGTQQSRYRIYLAGEAQWRSWYGGEDSDWAIGLAIPLNMHGIDVMLRMKELDDNPVMLRVALQHELGHVVTLSGAYRADAAEDTWLSEGIAEYIGWWPLSGARTLRRSSVRWALNRRAATSMIPVQPGPGAAARAGDAFYGLSHLAVDCMAKKYGDQRLFTFVRLVLTQDNELDQAARDAYGVPFTTVDRACVKWVRQQVL